MSETPDFGSTGSGIGLGRPRDAHVESRVYEATLSLLRDRGYTALRIDDVATTAKVAKTTIYRRWPSLSALVLDALASAIGPREAEPTGDHVADLETLTDSMYATIVTGPLAETVRAVGADLVHQPDLAADYRRRFVDPLRDAAIAIIAAGQRDGTFTTAADPALVVDALIGPVIYRGLIHEPMPAKEALFALGLTLLRPSITPE